MLFYLVVGIFGFVIGIFSGLFGFGGSSVSTPILRGILGVPAYLALASPFPMTLFSSFVSVHNYQKDKLVDWDMVAKLALTVIPGSIIGAYLTKYIPGAVLMYLTSAFLVYIAIEMIRKDGLNYKFNFSRTYVLPLGFLIGLVSGMLANGGGLLIVPLLILLGVDIKRAVATSMGVVFLAVTPSIVVHWWLGHINWWISLALILGVAPGSYIGSRLMVSVDKSGFKRWYGIFLGVMAVYLVFYEVFLG